MLWQSNYKQEESSQNDEDEPPPDMEEIILNTYTSAENDVEKLLLETYTHWQNTTEILDVNLKTGYQSFQEAEYTLLDETINIKDSIEDENEHIKDFNQKMSIQVELIDASTKKTDSYFNKSPKTLNSLQNKEMARKLEEYKQLIYSLYFAE